MVFNIVAAILVCLSIQTIGLSRLSSHTVCHGSVSRHAVLSLSLMAIAALVTKAIVVALSLLSSHLLILRLVTVQCCRLHVDNPNINSVLIMYMIYYTHI